MALDYDAILREIPRLQPNQLVEIRKKIGATLALCGVKTGEPAVEEPEKVIDDYLLEGIYQELRRRGLLARGGLPSRLIPPDFRVNSASARFCLQEQLGELSAPDRAALGQLAARALASYLERGKIPVGVSTMLKNVNKITSAIEASFPGYLASGLLKFCWRKM